MRGVVLGGTGAIGRATAHRLLSSGWHITVTGRNPGRMPGSLTGAGCEYLKGDRRDPDHLRFVLGEGADLVIDCACFTAADSELVIPFLANVGHVVMISSKAVYVDDSGNHVNSDVSPDFGGPLIESHATLAPGDGDYDTREGYGSNKVAAERALLDSGHPVSVLRASKVHGPGAVRPREWMFVKRVLDKRPVVLLSHGGQGVDHTTAAANTAQLIATIATHPDRRILNSADPDAPSVLEIARTIADCLDHSWEEVLLDPGVDDVGSTPWDSVPPVILDTTAAVDLGYSPVGTFAETVRQEIDWLVAAAVGGEDAQFLPTDDDPFFAPLLDYEAEERYLQARPEGLEPPTS